MRRRVVLGQWISILAGQSGGIADTGFSMAAQGEKGSLVATTIRGKANSAFPLWFFVALGLLASSTHSWAQDTKPHAPSVSQSPPELKTVEDWNKQLQQPSGDPRDHLVTPQVQEYRIGPDDLLEITVFEARELDRVVRVTAGGEISLPLLGPIRAAGLTPRELESVLQELLRRTYMQDPHVGVFVRQMESHPVSVFGAVKKPGVFQFRGPKTLIEVLSMAEGLADDAGDTVIVTRGASFRATAGTAAAPAQVSPAGEDDPAKWMVAQELQSSATGDAEAPSDTSEVNLKALLETGDPRYNIPVYPGDIVKVTRAGVVYVVGEVKKPGGFVLKTNEDISVLQALALAEGLTTVAAKSRARIIRTDEARGERVEIPIDLGKILDGSQPDPTLQAKDIVFVPNSAAKRGFYRAAEAAVSIVTGVIVWRR